MKPAELYEMLKKVQEPKGYFFNKDKDWVLAILQDLLINKSRYGYASCPCRLASGIAIMIKTLFAPVFTDRKT